jgi:hypothetical protein
MRMLPIQRRVHLCVAGEFDQAGINERPDREFTPRLEMEPPYDEPGYWYSNHTLPGLQLGAVVTRRN